MRHAEEKMAMRRDDKLSEAAGWAETTDSAEATGDAASLSEALRWAAERFQFDPNASDRQRGVESLQKWLQGHDASVPLESDARLGPRTLEFLERVYASQGETIAENEAPASSTGIGAKAGLDTAPDAPTEESAPNSKEDAVTARPVALSDSAIDDISQDRLGFTPYVEAVTEFILAEQTRPPLAIAINARWGQGKTSFMNMLDKELKRRARKTTTRVGTTWFNPWKYSEPEQVWAAFVANVTRCLRDNLTREQSWQFRWHRFRKKLQRHADFPMGLRLLVAFLFVLLVLTLPFTLDLAAFHESFQDKGGILGAFYAATEKLDSRLWWFFFGPFALLSLLYGYITFTKALGLNLLEYVEKTDFKDKIGTLSQFESEMRRLADAVPDDLKVVVFIDDLDRCRGKVLGEIIEALQLADVSRTCIFVLGMDMQIVATAIEGDRAELTASTGGIGPMEHGSGYKFLEKIIQARLSLPSHTEKDMANLVISAMAPDREELGPPTNQVGPGTQRESDSIRPTNLGGGSGQRQPSRETPSDSQILVRTAQSYGTYFNNPRRLKRFINGFRLQAYLANMVHPGVTDIDRLARFLVLAEKWPALLDALVRHHEGAGVLEGPTQLNLDRLREGDLNRLLALVAGDVSLSERDRKPLFELLRGSDGNDPLTAEQVQFFAASCGFFYYPGIALKNANP